MLTTQKRHLPHWTMDGSYYFITFHLIDGNLSLVEQNMVMEHIKSGHKRFYKLVAVQIMPNHVHLIISPINGYPLSRIMKGIKGASARMINLSRNSQDSLWKQESFDRIIRNELELIQKLQYMYENPLRAGLIEDLDNYSGWYISEQE